MFKAVVCDVGHVIARGSILNVILADIGRSDCARKLYDSHQFYSRNSDEFEIWVEDVIREKVAALHGLSEEMLLNPLKNVSMTPQFDHFIRQTGKLGIPVLLVGAVPEIIVHLLLKLWNLDYEHISIGGTKVFINDGKIADLQSVCTPMKKREIVESWIYDQCFDKNEVMYIGDSVGDLFAMSLFPKKNRIAINASLQLVKVFCDFFVEDDFSEITALIDTMTILENLENENSRI